MCDKDRPKNRITNTRGIEIMAILTSNRTNSVSTDQYHAGFNNCNTDKRMSVMP